MKVHNPSKIRLLSTPKIAPWIELLLKVNNLSFTQCWLQCICSDIVIFKRNHKKKRKGPNDAKAFLSHIFIEVLQKTNHFLLGIFWLRTRGWIHKTLRKVMFLCGTFFFFFFLLLSFLNSQCSTMFCSKKKGKNNWDVWKFYLYFLSDFFLKTTLHLS